MARSPSSLEICNVLLGKQDVDINAGKAHLKGLLVRGMLSEELHDRTDTDILETIKQLAFNLLQVMQFTPTYTTKPINFDQ